MDKSKIDTIYEQRANKLWIEKDKGYLYFLWDGFLTSEQYREMLQKGIKAVKDNRLRYWIWDLLEMSVLAKDDILWTVDEWYPVWKNSGIKAVYIIEPQHPFGRNSFKKLVNRDIIGSMNMKFFLSQVQLKRALEKEASTV